MQIRKNLKNQRVSRICTTVNLDLDTFTYLHYKRIESGYAAQAADLSCGTADCLHGACYGFAAGFCPVSVQGLSLLAR